MLEWFGTLDDKVLQMVLMAIYQIWQAHNDARDDGRIEDPLHTARSAFLAG